MVKQILALADTFAPQIQNRVKMLTIDTGDTAWVLVATIMVMIMAPAGLALFYGGLSQKKRIVHTIAMSYVAFCVATLAWIFGGYEIAFGGSHSNAFQFPFLSSVNLDSVVGTIPEILYVGFQGVLAAVAVSIISGAVAGKMKFATWVTFALLWVLFVYAPLVRIVWGNGLPFELGEVDFAGGSFIHVNAGIAGLVLALIFRDKNDKNPGKWKKNTSRLTILGSVLLWFGWFGFNAGSQLAADAVAANAIFVTNIAACAGGLAWMNLQWIRHQKPSMGGVAFGVIAGLVGITPAAGYVGATAALIIGGTSGIIGYLGVSLLRNHFKLGSGLEVFGIHGLVGIWGILTIGIFADPSVNAYEGMLYGNFELMWSQVALVMITTVVALIGSFVMYEISAFLTRGGRAEEEVFHNDGIERTFKQNVNLVE